MSKIYKVIAALTLLLGLCVTAHGEEAGLPVWSVEPAGIVRVDEDGLLTALAPGEATVIVWWDGMETSVRVTVDSVPCPFGDHEITHIDDMAHHTQAICGVE